MNTRHVFPIGLGTIVLLTGLGCLGCQGSNSTTASQNGEKATSRSPEDDESTASSENNSGESNSESGASAKEASNESAPPADLYPDMDFDRLDASDRKTFVSIAKGELCPCEGSNQSLHACLQSKETQCALAKRMSSLAVSGIQSGLNKTDIRDRMATFAERASKEYEFDLADTPHKGPKDAPVTIVEFADFQCPHCKAAAGLMKTIQSKFGDDVVHYFKHYPLPGHPKARLAAQAAVAAHQQDKFWPMHDLIFKHQRSLSSDKLVRFARQLGMNIGKFKKDLQSKEVTQAVAANKQEGSRVGVKGTPAIFINGQRYMGAQTEKGLTEAIRSALEASKSKDEGSSDE